MKSSRGMESLHPARITSLGAETIRVQVHGGGGTAADETFTLDAVYPFETVYSLKQRISLKYGESKTWLPSQLFVAQEAGGGMYKPLEFYWEFDGKLVADPLRAAGAIDARLWADDAMKPVFPKILSGVTIETAAQLAAAAAIRTIHVWNLETVARAAGYAPPTPPPFSDEAYGGFFRKYFPFLENRDALIAALAPLTVADSEAYATARAYRELMDARYAKINAGLAHPSVAASPLPRLRELRMLRYALPSKPSVAASVLELAFYKMNPTSVAPFIRFFPSQSKVAPLIKLARSDTGLPIIDAPRLLDALMADEPNTESGAVILVKSPITLPQAPLGTTWTLRIFHDGSGDLTIGAPRKDAPLSASVAAAAMEALPELLEMLDAALEDEVHWADLGAHKLVECAALYDYKCTLATKPTRAELRARLDAFLPFFADEPLPEKSRLSLALRYKAVSNYDESRDPVMDHISNIFLRGAAATVATIPAEAYVASLVQSFGMAPAEAAAALGKWIARRAEYIVKDRETEIAALNLGAAVGVSVLNHPNYSFALANVESSVDLARILSLLSVLVQRPSEELRVAPSAAAAADAAEVAEAADALLPDPVALGDIVEDVSQYATLGDFTQFGDFGDFSQFGANNDAAAPAAAPVAAPAAPQGLLQPDEKIAPIGDKWYLDRLVAADKALFEYSSKDPSARVKKYSVTCQKSSNRQPFVMTPENYARARKLYIDTVHWVEAPLTHYDLIAVTLASKTINQRKIPGVAVAKKDLFAYEKRALTLGFPLKGDLSITLRDAAASAAEKAEITALMAAQKTKPLWTVVRAGSARDHPNYYICATIWCVRDDLPLIPSEFEGTTLHNDAGVKAPNSCPFCGGVFIADEKHPAVGETVLRRGSTTTGTDKIARYVGYPKDIIHPDGFLLPCCFLDPDSLDTPATSQPPPVVAVPLPPAQAPIDADGVEETKEEEAAAAPLPAAVETDADRENRIRPFSEYTVSKKPAYRFRQSFVQEKTALTSTINKWFIANQNIVGRIATEWYELKLGEAGVPPPSVNKLLGQNPDAFLTETKGVRGVSINSYLKTPGNAFVRLGTGGTFADIIAYANYATAALMIDRDLLKIPTIAELVDSLLAAPRDVTLFHAFQQANYGTLIHEFSVGNRAIADVEFQTWCGRVGIPLPEQRPYAMRAYRAWLNFIDYLRNPRAPKDMRLFEGLCSAPRVLTPTGFVLVRIIAPKNPAEPATIQCPTYGVSLNDQVARPPILFVVQDEATGECDPLVFYNSTSKEDRALFGVFQPDSVAFNALPPHIQEPLNAFYAQYMNPIEGCGRTTEPLHPWMPVLESTFIPRLRTFVERSDDARNRIQYLLRDRSNRLVGAVIKPPASTQLFYIPVLDDGKLLPGIPSLLGEDALPHPPLKPLLELLIGARYPPAAGKLAGADNFPGLLPVKLIRDATNYIAVELKCGALIPFEPFPVTSEIRHDVFQRMVTNKRVEIETRRDFPWDTDVALLGPALPPDTPPIDRTDEETLDEAYQYLRISFSHWLHATTVGNNVRRQIELLRRARNRLPLWELRKRLDILLLPYISTWITREGSAAPSLLRRDCLQIKKKDACVAGCTWVGADVGGRCLIHTTATERYVAPERVMVARLVDELIRTFGAADEILRQRVPFLRQLDPSQIRSDEDGILFSATGRGTEELYERLGYSGRKPTAYTRALVYPEEVDAVSEKVAPEDVLPADWASVFKVAVFGADVGRDARSRFVAALTTLTGQTIAALEARGGAPITGSAENWRGLAGLLRADVLTTTYDPTTRRMAITHWYSGVAAAGAGAAERSFIVVDINGVPLQSVADGGYIVPQSKLPASIRAKLDAIVRE